MSFVKMPQDDYIAMCNKLRSILNETDKYTSKDFIEKMDELILPNLDEMDFGNNSSLPEKGNSNPQYYEDIAKAINEIKQEAAVVLEELNVTESKKYTAPSGVAYSSVNVAVPQTTVEPLTVTENGIYTASAGTAWNEVEVDVPTSSDPSSTSLDETIYNNGGYSYSPTDKNVDYFDSVNITVEVPDGYEAGRSEGYNEGYDSVLNSGNIGKVVVLGGDGDAALTAQTSGTFIENGTYDTTTISSVTVNVPSSSGYEKQTFNQGGLSESDLLAALGNGMFASLWGELAQMSAVAYLRLTSQALGLDNETPLMPFGIATGPFLIGSGLIVDTSTTPLGTMGGYLKIGLDENGAPEFKAAYLMQNGTLTDISPYLGQCTFAIRVNIFSSSGD